MFIFETSLASILTCLWGLLGNRTFWLGQPGVRAPSYRAKVSWPQSSPVVVTLLCAHIPGTHQEALGCLPHRPGNKCIPSAHLGPGPLHCSAGASKHGECPVHRVTQIGNNQRPLTVMTQETAGAEDMPGTTCRKPAEPTTSLALASKLKAPRVFGTVSLILRTDRRPVPTLTWSLAKR